MSAAEGFMSKFDEEGRFRDRDGVLDVVIMTSGGNRYPGKLHFHNGLCIRAEMEGGSPWAFPDNSPLDQIRFVLYFEGETPRVIHLDQGRIVHQNQVPERPTKKDFLTNLRVARNLFFHPQRVEADSATVDIGVITDAVARAAIWLTPKSVAGYNAADFPELALTGRWICKQLFKTFWRWRSKFRRTKPRRGNSMVMPGWRSGKFCRSWSLIFQCLMRPRTWRRLFGE